MKRPVDKTVKIPEGMLTGSIGKLEFGANGVDRRLQLLTQINALPDIQETLSENDVVIYPFKIAGDAVNSQNGRFRTTDLPAMLQMMNGVALLVGHDTDKLPAGRFFGGVVTSENGVNYIKPYFYLLKEISETDDLVAGIKGGIYREGSIGFRFTQATCSICGNDMWDMRKCEHIPGAKYDGVLCFYWYDGVKYISEGSIVYMGAHDGTGIGRALDEALAEKRNNLQVDKNLRDEMELIKEIRLSLGLGDEVDEAGVLAALKTRCEKVESLEAEKVKLVGYKTTAEAALSEMRLRVESLQNRLLVIDKSAVTDVDRTDATAAGYDELKRMERLLEGTITKLSPKYRCPECQAEISALRVSEGAEATLDEDAKDEKADRRAMNMNSRLGG